MKKFSLFSVFALFLTVLTAPASDSNLLGPYGFLSSSVMGPQTEAEARSRVAVMAKKFGIREFMFYDWFADYSTPVRGEAWTDAFFRQKPIHRQTLEWYIDEIHQQGGRAWAYVQVVGSERDDLADPDKEIYPLKRGDGKWYWHPEAVEGEGRFPTYFPNRAWAEHMVNEWAPAVKELGFDGIHWDTLGPIAGDGGAEAAGLHAFLKHTHHLLKSFGLKQTLNFVNLHAWDEDIARQYVEFPYAEIWSQDIADRYLSIMKQWDGPSPAGVWAMYPGAAVPDGWTSTQVILHRHRQAAAHNLAWVIIGDGPRRMKNEYWPNTVPLTPREQQALQANPD